MSRITLFFLTALMALPAAAQTGRPEMLDDDRIMPHETQTLQLKVDNMFFFKDNEYDGNVQKGYSLPGVWIRPRLTYQPTRRLRLEVGLHALAYHAPTNTPTMPIRTSAPGRARNTSAAPTCCPFCAPS